MAALVANEDLEVNFVNQGQPPDAVYTADVGIDALSVVPTKSTKAFANSKAVCTTSIVITWSATPPLSACPHTSATHTFVSGAGVIPATATKCTSLGAAVLRQGDNAIFPAGCSGVWTNNATGNPVVCACNMSISNAGQTKVSAT